MRDLKMAEFQAIKMAYLISRYPAVSHTFVQREIQALRLKGFSIFVASINEPDISKEQWLPADSEEYKNTFYVKKQGALKAALITLTTFAQRPLSFLAGFFFALSLGKTDLKKIFYHLFYLAEAVLVGNWMQKNNIKHVHVHFANPASSVALILTRIFPFTFSMTVHGPDEFYDVTLNNLKEKIEGAAFIFCISNYARSQLLRISDPEAWDKIETVRLGVDPDIYTPNTIKEHPSPIEILCVGRLTLTKGQHILIKAMQHLVRQGRQVRLQLVGDGPDRPRLEQQALRLGLQENIVFKGALNREGTLNVYKTADIFALASFAEGLPVVLMEAMSMEIPCITTGINGIPEIIKNEINGLLVAPSDDEETAQAIARLIDDVPLRRKLGKEGRSIIMEKYNLRINIEYLAGRFTQRLADKETGGK